MFGRVLIANRGEIAVRIARTLARMGVESIAIFSDADADAPHVRAADRAIHIGAAPALESYLNIEAVIAAARTAGAEAIHPGYGFLSERSDFAQACIEAGMTFIGPSPEAIAMLGDKAAAKQAAAAAGVPVVPGSAEETTDEQITVWAEGQKLPILLKAVGGGGGKGMRVVRSLADLPDALAATRREARSGFGDERLIAERYLERARHIEVQVLGDLHGTVLHLGERECTLQRRHQKVIEEAPSPVVGSELRERMCKAAVALAKSCGYAGAGTVELIAERDRPERFYFLEMNARLQVEHPVTEATTGLDLVELQLRVAAGERLPIAQEDVTMRGHAIEARIYAEDPANGFLPATGRVAVYREPHGAAHGGERMPGRPARAPVGDEDSGAYAGGRRQRRRQGTYGSEATLRLDSGVAAGSTVGTAYDPMLAKAIAHAPERQGALRALARGLEQTVIAGPVTNTAWLRALLARSEVQAGEIDTTLIERLGDQIAPPPPDAQLLAGVAVIALLGRSRPEDPWWALDGWRANGRAPATMRLQLESAPGSLSGPSGTGAGGLDGAPIEAVAEPLDDGAWRVGQTIVRPVLPDFDPTRPVLPDFGPTVGQERPGRHLPHRSGSPSEPASFWVREPDGRARLIESRLDSANDDLPHHNPPGVWLIDRGVPTRWTPAQAAAGGRAAAGSLQAPMPGVILEVRVSPGDTVAEGQTLVVLESMKMELTLASPADGIVEAVSLAVGDTVSQGQSLLSLASAGEHDPQGSPPSNPSNPTPAGVGPSPSCGP